MPTECTCVLSDYFFIRHSRTDVYDQDAGTGQNVEFLTFKLVSKKLTTGL